MSHLRVLIAAVSAQDGQQLEVALERAGWDVVRVSAANEAACEFERPDRSAVLLIDAGLLQMAHDAQWRALRGRYPELGTVVRCLGRTIDLAQAADDGIRTVQPDDLPGISEAIRRFGWRYRAAAGRSQPEEGSPARSTRPVGVRAASR